MISVKNTTHIQSALLDWYAQSAIPYPWRGKGASPYVILVSEFMLQQTQASRVASLLPAFLKVFPTLASLSAATNAQIITAWRGLGYNNRAIRLRDTALAITTTFNGVVPDEPSVLRTLPGIGAYSSESLPCFIYGTRTIVVDVNVRRVYSRLMTSQPHTGALESMSSVRTFAKSIIPDREAATWHHAVMDLGSTICKARSAHCEACPLTNVCPSAYLPKAPFQTQRKKEPLLRGEPRRLWRGRLVEKLRDAGKDGLHLEALLPDATACGAELAEWMTLIDGLKADGVISVGKTIALSD